MTGATSFRAVVFDCDGVLVDSEAPLAAIDQRMLADLGWQMTLQEVHDRFVGHTAAHFVEEVERHLGGLPVGWREPYEPLVHRALHEDLQAVDGVLDVLAGLDVPVAVASNSSHARVRESLALVGLLQHFGDLVVGSDDVVQGKPAPDVYLRAADLLAVPPTTCVAVEDSVTGVRSARAAGMTVFGYAAGLTAPGPLRAAGAVTFSSMAELPALLSGA
ncbi:HAD family hydrolase [Curtobacterium sp. SL109]|uniref:HAD family hydrolase n=1 Tax=Curtobacterium sp. SL109 TaxID=2994662 RepID=UPI002275C175|nr:HAD family phosphatase [Curtobacterium sp. SL109]MCY1693518.1 HAD family phosphatase [Curtobacterium sp. SL109]